MRRFIQKLVAMVVLTMSGVTMSADNTDLGAKLPDGAKRVGEHRFRSPSNYEQTLKHYKSVYGTNFPRRAIINQPGIKAVHIVNSSTKGDWAGLNIYETNDEVRIYVVPRG
jgi:hypothetical protein